MSEREKQISVVRVIDFDEVMTEVGPISRSEVIFEDNTRTVYLDAYSDTGYSNLIKEIVTAEQKKVDPKLVRRLNAMGTTPERFVKEESREIIKDFRAQRYSADIHQHVLGPLVRQEAMSKLFQAAKQAQRPR